MTRIKIYVYNEVTYTDPDQFRKVFKNVSFPKTITDDMLMARGVVVKEEVEPEESFEDKKAKKLLELQTAYSTAVSGSVSVQLNDTTTIRMLFAEKDLLMVRAMLDKMTDASVDNGVLVDVDDNVYMNLDKDTVNKVYQAMLDKQFGVYMTLKQYQIAINTAKTKEELEGINILF